MGLWVPNSPDSGEAGDITVYSLATSKSSKYGRQGHLVFRKCESGSLRGNCRFHKHWVEQSRKFGCKLK